MPDPEYAGPTYTPKRGTGRPSALTPEARTVFLAVLRTGVSVRHAARAVGLKPETVEHWLLRGRGKLADRGPAPEYVSFVAEVEAAKSHLVRRLANKLIDTLDTGKYPDLSMRLLERLDPESFGGLMADRPADDPEDLLRLSPAIAQPPLELPAGESEESLTLRETIRTVTVPADRFADFARMIRGSDRTHAESAQRLAQFRDDDVPST